MHKARGKIIWQSMQGNKQQETQEKDTKNTELETGDAWGRLAQRLAKHNDTIG